MGLITLITIPKEKKKRCRFFVFRGKEVKRVNNICCSLILKKNINLEKTSNHAIDLFFIRYMRWFIINKSSIAS